MQIDKKKSIEKKKIILDNHSFFKSLDVIFSVVFSLGFFIVGSILFTSLIEPSLTFKAFLFFSTAIIFFYYTAFMILMSIYKDSKSTVIKLPSFDDDIFEIILKELESRFEVYSKGKNELTVSCNPNLFRNSIWIFFLQNDKELYMKVFCPSNANIPGVFTYFTEVDIEKKLIARIKKRLKITTV